MTHKALAAISYPDAGEFQVEPIEIESPRADEILVRIRGVGICHTDLIYSSGAVPYPFPAVFGHEGSGEVIAIGSGVTKVAVGDHVLITFRSCGDCDLCHFGDAAYCRSMVQLNVSGAREDGSTALTRGSEKVASNFFGQSSFASHCITYERNVVKVESDLPIELLGPIGCSIQTGTGAVMRSIDTRRGSSILITGAGSVGLSAVMGAVIQQCATIIVVEPVAARRQLALELGAPHCIDPLAVSDLSSEVMKIAPLGVDNAVDSTARADILEHCLACLGPKATLGLVGLGPPDEKLPGEVNDLFAGGKTIRAIVEGDSNPDEFIPELLAHYREGRLPIEKLITTYPLKDINRAIEDQKSGACIKPVLIPGD